MAFPLSIDYNSKVLARAGRANGMDRQSVRTVWSDCACGWSSARPRRGQLNFSERSSNKKLNMSDLLCRPAYAATPQVGSVIAVAFVGCFVVFLVRGVAWFVGSWIVAPFT